ncbi:hypothetical protein A5780_32445 [Nocardia sp. 852002-20019_SCH5090214]|uniref:hypothetical protein n=1 Tax=Nocardia TaxID=1817 RepID=UPI0007A557AB|nr:MULTISPECIES: hypothetical protein [Nocardia]MCC3311408.1 hypothetical protein [Nocardia africana]OBA49235.1 hypothetical protein A5780_32445 [Nocardia sp. 852002-20019_SCH5090214]
MKNNTVTAAILASAAIAAAPGTAHAAPVPAHTASTDLTDHGVGYTVTGADGHSAVVRATNSRFAARPDARSVAVIDAADATVTTIPLGLRTTESGLVPAPASISDDRRTLTLAPASAAAHPVDDASDTIARKQHNAGVGALIGGGIGAVLGFFLGGVGALVTVPIGAGIGALIGYATP